MENKRGSGIFLSVIGVATLIVAIIGATFAYFSATAASNNEAITVESTKLALGYKDITDGLKTDMIPSTSAIAEFAAFDADWIAGEKTYTLEDDNGEEYTITAQGQCVDQNGNEICSFYEFYVGNPSTTTNMDVEGTLTVVKNEFKNLKFTIFDEAGTSVVSDTFPGEGQTYNLTALNQTLIAFEGVEDREGELADVAFDSEDPSTYNPAVDKSDEDNADADTNVRHYRMLIWIDETGKDQTEDDSGKIFSAGISFETGGASGGVTGMIAVANAGD